MFRGVTDAESTQSTEPEVIVGIIGKTKTGETPGDPGTPPRTARTEGLYGGRR